MAGMSLVKNKFELYKCSANEAIHFKLVRQESDLEDDNTSFCPDMTHQVFGEQESIFGFRDLVLEMFYSAARLTTYIGLKYSDKVTPEKFDGLQADNVLQTIAKDIPPGFLSNKEEFISTLHKDANFKPFGELMHSYKVIKNNEERHFEVYKTDIEAPGFRDYHERLQTFILYFIDAASFIDVDDERWSFYLLFEKYKFNGNPMYAVAGYLTVYNYYAYPAKVRPRISQVLVLPPFQKQGHCANLVQTFYNDCYKRSDILDITVEDPSENFQRVRDFVDVKNCMKLPSFQPQHLHQGFTEDMMKEAKQELKLNKHYLGEGLFDGNVEDMKRDAKQELKPKKRQARRVYEILRLKATDPSNKEQYKEYRLDMKRRLNGPFQKNGRDFEKLQKALQPDELTATLSSISLEQRQQILEKTFQDNVEMYRQVIDRIATFV